MSELIIPENPGYMNVPPSVLDSIYEVCYCITNNEDVRDIGHIAKEYRRLWSNYWGDFT